MKKKTNLTSYFLKRKKKIGEKPATDLGGDIGHVSQILRNKSF
jgi:hypothetical protein